MQHQEIYESLREEEKKYVCKLGFIYGILIIGIVIGYWIYWLINNDLGGGGCLVFF